ncbi:MAG: hypothetical protein KIT27_01260 [Legionellales bacterium]|nr:hypothetical protein [Legionellales bacterium]
MSFKKKLNELSQKMGMANVLNKAKMLADPDKANPEELSKIVAELQGSENLQQYVDHLAAMVDFFIQEQHNQIESWQLFKAQVLELKSLTKEAVKEYLSSPAEDDKE